MEFPEELSYFNIDSNPQMQEFLYEFLELKPLTERNDKGNISVAENVINAYAAQGVKFCELLIKYRKLTKAKDYLNNIFRNISWDDGKIHPNFSLTTTETYRSSSSDPNFQNIPVHGSIINGFEWKTIRSIFCALPGSKWLLSEVDYDGAEAKVAGMISADPQLCTDLNSGLDIHGHWAIELFGLKGMSYKEVKKEHSELRFLSKNNFVFASFYGSLPASIARNLREQPSFESFVKGKYKSQYRKNKSWDSYYIDFSDELVAKCQESFYQRYKILKKWQDETVDNYYKNGYVENPFGFRRRYPLERNMIVNYPIQSTSFLLLLDSIIQVNDELNNGNWESHLLGQIHDSINANVVKWEAPDFIDLVDDKMTNKPHLPWTKRVKMDTDWSFGKKWSDMFKVSDYKSVKKII